MIHMLVSVLPPSTFAVLTGRPIPVAGPNTLPADAVSNPHLMVTFAEGAEQFSFEAPIGSLAEGDQAYGYLRDHEVNHLNAKAEVAFYDGAPVQRQSSVGGYDVKRTGSTWENVNALFEWGSGGSFSSGLPTYRYSRESAYDAEVRGSSGTWTLRSSGATAVLVSQIHAGATYKVSDGSLWVGDGWYWRVQDYVRIGAVLYRTRQVDGTGLLTDSDVETYLENVLTHVSGSTPTVPWRSYDQVRLGDEAEGIFWTFYELCSSYLGQAQLSLEEHPADFGELALECAQQLRFVDQNILSLAFDIDDWERLYEKWSAYRGTPLWLRLKSIAMIRGPKRRRDKYLEVMRKDSSMFLFWKYAVLPTVSDLRRLLAGAKKCVLGKQQQRLHSRRITPLGITSDFPVTHTAALTVQCDSYPTWFTGRIQEYIGYGKRWGLYPELTTLWDVLPYSFVVDWFLNFGDLFKDVDAYLTVKNYFPVQYCIQSEKWEQAVPSTALWPGKPVSGDVQFSYYTRWITSGVPLPNVSLNTGSGPNEHSVEAGALVLQRMKFLR